MVLQRAKLFHEPYRMGSSSSHVFGIWCFPSPALMEENSRNMFLLHNKQLAKVSKSATFQGKKTISNCVGGTGTKANHDVVVPRAPAAHSWQTSAPWTNSGTTRPIKPLLRVLTSYKMHKSCANPSNRIQLLSDEI